MTKARVLTRAERAARTDVPALLATLAAYEQALTNLSRMVETYYNCGCEDMAEPAWLRVREQARALLGGQ